MAVDFLSLAFAIETTRSVQTATQAKVKGGGFEGEYHYSRWRRMHNNLKSYFAQQESLVKIVEACNDKSGNMDRWLSKIESSDWLDYVKRSLDASCLVAQCVDRQGWSVLVHGSDGFDSTLTVTSVAQIILDSECRTIRGFLTLIDREWLQGGHPFTERTSHGPYRLRGKLRANTVSLWSMILSPSMFDKYVNPLYRRNDNVIWPSVAPQSLEFWDEYYISDLAPVNPILDRVKILQSRRTELEIMKRRVTQLTEGNHAVSTEDPTNSKNFSSYEFHDSNGAPIENEAQPQEPITNDNLIKLSPDSALAASPAESLDCVYVPISSDVSQGNHPDNYSVNSQPDLLEDLLSFVTDAAAPNDIDTQNLPDLDDLAIDSVNSESPDAVSPTPS